MESKISGFLLPRLQPQQSYPKRHSAIKYCADGTKSATLCMTLAENPVTQPLSQQFLIPSPKSALWPRTRLFPRKRLGPRSPVGTSVLHGRRPCKGIIIAGHMQWYSSRRSVLGRDPERGRESGGANGIEAAERPGGSQAHPQACHPHPHGLPWSFEGRCGIPTMVPYYCAPPPAPNELPSVGRWNPESTGYDWERR